MNIINRVALRTMKLNRVRTIVTIIGIILSTAMFTAVFTICTSLYNFVKESEVYSSGTYHIHVMRLPADDIGTLREDPRTEYTALAVNLGYAAFDSANHGKPYICVMAVDGVFAENMPIHITEGRMPQNENELLLPVHILTNGGSRLHTGDTVELSLGQRVSVDLDGREGEALYQETAYTAEYEQLSGTDTESYTIVGIYERPDFEPYYAPGYTALTVLTGNESADARYDCWLRVTKPAKNYYSYVKDHSDIAQNGAEEHSMLLGLEGAIRYDNLKNVLISFAVILSVLIFVGSVALIYSAFSISVSERTKQFGLLSSIGATRKQIMRSVLSEALTLSGIGIPIGAAAGVGGIALTLWLLRDKFASLLNTNSTQMRVHVTWPGIAIAAAVALITVLVSAWIPSRRAMRVSPMEAIRQARDVKANEKKATRYPKLFAKLFGAEGMLAKKYFARNRNKYRATIISLVMSVVLFVAASGFCLYMTRSVNSVDNRPNFDGYFGTLSRQEFERLRPALAENATEFAGYIALGEESSVYAYLPDEVSTPEYKALAEKSAQFNGELSYNQYALKVYMDDDAFRKMLSDNGLSEEGWFDAEAPKAVMLNYANVTVYERQSDDGFTRTNYVVTFVKDDISALSVAESPGLPNGWSNAGVYWSGEKAGEGALTQYAIKLGEAYADEELEFDEYGRPVGQLEIPLEFNDIEIGALIENAPVGVSTEGTIKLIYPLSVYPGSSEIMDFSFRSGDTQKSIEAMTRILEAADIAVGDNSFLDAAEDGRLMNNIVTIVKVFSYGFITLISLISVANVFNTVTTNVALRRRDYAMLRSMGMTQKGMNRMSNFECLIYGSRSLLIGLPIAIGVTYLIHLAANDAAHMRFTLPWTAIAIAVVSVFLVVFVSMLYSTGKLKKDNPIDALKDENI